MHAALTTIDWAAEGAAAVGLLRSLLAVDTSNPPGAEEACAELVAEHLRGSGLEPVLLAAAPGRPNVIARLRGDGDEPPLMLSAHLDVVPAAAERWTHPPFAAEVADGWIWGRGAVDDKHMAAASLVALRLLATSGVRLRRDVILTAVADEEDGCGLGSAWLVREHPDLVRAGYVLGEVGGFTLHIGGRALYPVQVAEKGACALRARASGASGHGSMPRRDDGVTRLAAFLQRLSATRLPPQRSAALDRFLTDLAATQPLPARALLPLVGNRWLSGPMLSLLERRQPALARSLSALSRNTAAATMVSGGARTNVIPGTAEALLDGRIAVGSSQEELLAQLRRLAGPHVEIEVFLGDSPPVEQPIDTDLFATIADVVAEHHPGAVALPTIIPGFTDGRFWSELGAVCYGFTPVRLEPDDPPFWDLFHAEDERIPVAGFTAGVRMLADVVFRFCAA